MIPPTPKEADEAFGHGPDAAEAETALVDGVLDADVTYLTMSVTCWLVRLPGPKRGIWVGPVRMASAI